MKYIFGPVNSRRLGLSLGVDLLPDNICNFDCIYCEVGKTLTHSSQRREYSPVAEITSEIDSYLQKYPDRDFDVCTVTATGEPTLHSGIGHIISHLKQVCGKPVVVLTNGSLLGDPAVRIALGKADIVVPSLDSANANSFRRINRPAHGCPDQQQIIKGIKEFAADFKGKIWLEILFAQGVNDSPEDIAALVKTVKEIKPDKVQLNTVVRPPAESFVAPVSRQKMEEIAQQFDMPVEIVADFTKEENDPFRQFNDEEVINMLMRRPCTAADICQALKLDPHDIASHLETLEQSNRITRIKHHGKNYYNVI